MSTYVSHISVLGPTDFGPGPKRYRWQLECIRADGKSFGRVVWGQSFDTDVRPVLRRFRYATWAVNGVEIDSPMRRAKRDVEAMGEKR